MAHTSVTLGGQILGQPGLIHRRLDAGEARRGGEVRDSSSGDRMAGGGHLRDADELAHRVVVAVGPGVAGVVAGVVLGGRRSSGELGVDATVAREARAGHLRALRGAGRKLSTTDGPLGGRRLVGGGHRRRRVRASKVRRLRRTRARTERGKRFGGSRRLQQTSKRARGRPDGDESTMGIRGGRR